ncbi:8-oxo-dGTP diphosphatase [Paraburkholderia lycopersici]|uniref:8-oxo-dGTP diphosphatase n=2 Tax=Paraburkholderia lycopersici TaxID=416944 RepID=A0A1G6YJU3_9BURK|nr:8-oxo-dGTP diphosphatase [Paraburkholderia lycopersici]
MHEETLIVAESLTYLFAFGGLSKRHYVFAFDLPDDAIPQPANEIVRCCWVQPASIATLTTSVPTREIVTHLCVPAAKHPQVSPDR